MKTPAQLEKLGVGKPQRKLVKAAIGTLAYKPPGRLTVASMDDPREAADPSQEASDEFDDGEDFG